VQFVKERESEKLLANYFVSTDLVKNYSYKAHGQ
jgi:hypothetical protein